MLCAGGGGYGCGGVCGFLGTNHVCVHLGRLMI